MEQLTRQRPEGTTQGETSSGEKNKRRRGKRIQQNADKTTENKLVAVCEEENWRKIEGHEKENTSFSILIPLCKVEGDVLEVKFVLIFCRITSLPRLRHE